MRNLISVAVILHVAFTEVLILREKQVEFGDMIAYPPVCEMRFITYQHYAIYVGDGYHYKNDIFERLKDTETPRPICTFSELDSNDNPYVFNFLDGFVDKKGKVYTKGTETEMKARIKEKRANCGRYDALSNNCEHLATYVRYGKKISLQFNLTGQAFCLSQTARAMWKHVKEMND